MPSIDRANWRAIAVEAAMVVVGLTVVATAATYPLIREMSTHLPNDLGDSVLNAWILAWDGESLRHGLRHLWDAPSFFPYTDTLAYSDHLLGLAIFTAPIQWLTGNPVLAYNVAFVASFAQAGGGMYVLARSLTGRRDAALIASLIYAFTPFRIAHIAHLQWLMTGWLPLSLWALHRYFSTSAWRYLLAAGGFFVLQTLTASYFAYLSLLPLVAVGIAGMRRARPPLTRLAWHLAAAGVLVFLALAPVMRVYSRVREANGFRRPFAEILLYSADLSDYFRVHHFVRIWPFPRHGSGEHELFPGVVALTLAGVALFMTRQRRASAVAAYATIAAAAFVFSFGPQPTAWGHRSPWPGPYQVLLDVVPGLDGLRAPARLDAVVVLALSVLAAYGTIRLLDPVAPGRRSYVVAALAMAIVAEGWAAPIKTTRFDPEGDSAGHDAYKYLRTSAPGAVLEMPISLGNEERELKYQYLTLVHGHRTVNGHSSYDTPLLLLLGSNDEQSPFHSPDRFGAAIAMVRAVGVRYLVVHLDDFEDRAFGDALMRELDADGRQVVAKQVFGRTVVFTLAPDAASLHGTPEASTALKPVPASAIQPRASQATERLPLMFDGDRDTRWLSGDRQTGNEWIELTLDRPRDVGLVRIQTAARSFSDYPRELAVDVIEDAGTRTVFRGSVLPQFGRGIAADPAYPNIDLVLPANRSQRLRLRQLGSSDRLYLVDSRAAALGAMTAGRRYCGCFIKTM